MKARIISIGTELTTGQSLDTNSMWLSQRLAEAGIRVEAHVTVEDDLEPIRGAVVRAAQAADVVLISGGLGPTEDDLTRQGLAAAMGVGLEVHPRFVEHIRGIFARRGMAMPETNRVQAMFPVGAEPIENTCGTAPGMRARVLEADVYVMPGVPREMKMMFDRHVFPRRVERGGGRVILTKLIQTFGTGESVIGERIVDLMQRGENPQVGTTAQQGVIGIRIVATGASREEAQRMIEETSAEVKGRLGKLVFGEDDETLSHAIAKLLVEKSRTLSAAESCTGGLIAKWITDLSGSSRYFLEGVVTYSNEAKTRLLGVPADLVAAHGAVSAAVAEAMAVNCRARSGSDYAVSVTGIAGPTGGSAEKPVGLVFIGVVGPDGCVVREVRLGECLTREEIRDRAAKAAMNLLRLRLME